MTTATYAHVKSRLWVISYVSIWITKMRRSF